MDKNLLLFRLKQNKIIMTITATIKKGVNLINAHKLTNKKQIKKNLNIFYTFI